MRTPHTLDHYEATDRAIGRRITKSFGAWLEECERHDTWHELPDEQRQPTLANAAAATSANRTGTNAQPAARKEFVKFAPCEPSAYFLLR